ncbi:MAG: sulfatase [Gemmataceae bacterium]|nr:sulfatase [Gemmataceae bacterium]MCI0737962.1 sulfatase [Gemmataceae bacterium]
MKLRRVLVVSVISVGLVPGLVCASAEREAATGKQPAKRPNILFIMSDDHASAAIGAYGSWLKGVVKTPNLDRLARQGMRFTSTLVTNSICTPSRAAILTGQYSHGKNNGVYTLADPINPKAIHLGHLFQQAGYLTALVGKWHLISDPQGFDYWNILPGQGRYIDPQLRPMGKKPKELTTYKGKYSEDVITDLCLDWMKNRDKSKPFLLFCHYKAPHRPWDPAPRFVDLYKDVTIPEPPTLLDNYKGRAKVIAECKNVIGEHMVKTDLGVDIPKDKSREELRKWAYQVYMKRYLSCIAAVDENVGRLLDFLDKEGLADETIVIYTSDQGFFLGEHGFYDKRLMYEPCLTTPLLIRYPGRVPGGKTNNDMVLNIDHAPTLLEFAGIANPGGMHGKSYKTILEGSTPKNWRKSAYYRYYMHLDGSHNIPACYGVRTDRYTLIHYYGKGLKMKGAKDIDHEPEWELFDRQKDPEQIRNAFSDPSYAGVIRDLRAELERLRKELQDPL